jgi:uncharacterized protein (UPF0254 family)
MKEIVEIESFMKEMVGFEGFAVTLIINAGILSNIRSLWAMLIPTIVAEKRALMFKQES